LVYFSENTTLSRKHQTRAQPPLQNKTNEHTSADSFCHAARTAPSHAHRAGYLCFDSAVLQQSQLHTREQEGDLDEIVLYFFSPFSWTFA